MGGNLEKKKKNILTFFVDINVEDWIRRKQFVREKGCSAVTVYWRGENKA